MRAGVPPEGFQHRQVRLFRPIVSHVLLMASHTAGADATAVRHTSTTAVLPMPASPVTHTLWGCPWCACAQAAYHSRQARA
jgi:hypothetical protein